ncbi:hypothetical protein V8F33_007872 [Rhypophila sp. PSN 637]
MSLPVPSTVFEKTSDQFISEHGFRIVLWIGLALCFTTFSLRSYIRYVCFGKLLAEDYLMVLAFGVLVAIATISLIFLGDIYWMLAVENGKVIPGPDVFDRIGKSLRASGLISVLNMIGIWTIKLNFMLFFYRLGHQIRVYRIFWWIAVVVVMSCGIVALGVVPYRCHFQDVMSAIAECGTSDGLTHVYVTYIVSVAVDALSDFIILCFPIMVLWRTKIGLRQKVVLSSIFSLVGFTIAVTIVRGSIFGGTYKSIYDVDRKVMDTSWLMFWFYIQYITSFIVACLVSFRSLWAHREQQTRDKSEKERLAARARAEFYARQHGSSSLKNKSGKSGQNYTTGISSQASRWTRFQETVFSTFRDLEGTNVSQDDVLLDNRHASSIMVQGDYMPGDHEMNWSTTSKVRAEEISQVGTSARGHNSVSSRGRDSL